MGGKDEDHVDKLDYFLELPGKCTSVIWIPKNNHCLTQWVREVSLPLWVPILFRKQVLPNNALVLRRKISPEKYASDEEFIDFYWEELE
jgi:hypothetical protein